VKFPCRFRLDPHLWLAARLAMGLTGEKALNGRR